MQRYGGEPDLAEVLSDPIVQALMRADRCDLRSLYESIELVRKDEMSAHDAERRHRDRPVLG